MNAMEVKDQMLWSAFKERDEVKTLLEQEKTLCQQYATELGDWATLAQQLVQQLHDAKQEAALLRSRNEEMKQVLKDNNIIFIEDDDDDDHLQTEYKSGRES